MTDTSLQQGLKNRHVGMIAIGGVIGAGLFVGSGAGIHGTGPAILISYGIAGLLVVLVMRMLGEMSAASPDTGSFSAYADRAIGRWAGFTIGWLYWWFWAVVLAVEATAGAKIVHGWIPGLPQWALSLILMILLTATNLFSVGSYGEFEFWFSTIKVVAIGVFIVLGVLAIFGLLPGTDSVGGSNLTGHGGFFPHGYGAVITGLLTVVFAFMGSEIVTIAAGESRDPGRAVTKAVNSVIWRILVFYLGSIAVVITLLPWNAGSVATSPYVAVLDNIGISGAGTIMDVIVLTAVLSCLNSGLYTASRMAFSLAERGDAPKSFSRTNRRGVPYVAIWVSVAFGFVAVVFNYTSPDTVFLFLLNGSGAVALFVWAVIAVSELRMRRRLEREAPERILVRMWLYPYLTVATIVGIAAILVVMLFDHDGRPQVLWSMAVAAVVLVAAFVRHGRARAAEPAMADMH
ncbi:amino acid permease [Actinomadura sp. DC4]|uniref:amino acid permease n=1 Tax=Actinomadura sp. DC4 TaxID=3055069 RepID=UPI0025AEF244|nr:amino acid permease [Actinomadura sp. DC4]MDN3352402.1 amino acid permease [Actinomadura sp. DC4]